MTYFASGVQIISKRVAPDLRLNPTAKVCLNDFLIAVNERYLARVLEVGEKSSKQLTLTDAVEIAKELLPKNLVKKAIDFGSLEVSAYQTGVLVVGETPKTVVKKKEINIANEFAKWIPGIFADYGLAPKDIEDTTKMVFSEALKCITMTITQAARHHCDENVVSVQDMERGVGNILGNSALSKLAQVHGGNAVFLYGSRLPELGFVLDDPTEEHLVPNVASCDGPTEVAMQHQDGNLEPTMVGPQAPTVCNADIAHEINGLDIAKNTERDVQDKVAPDPAIEPMTSNFGIPLVTGESFGDSSGSR